MSLRDASERVMRATPEERRALIVDLQHERAEITYRLEHCKARIAVLELMLRLLPAKAKP